VKHLYSVYDLKLSRRQCVIKSSRATSRVKWLKYENTDVSRSISVLVLRVLKKPVDAAGSPRRFYYKLYSASNNNMNTWLTFMVYQTDPKIQRCCYRGQTLGPVQFSPYPLILLQIDFYKISYTVLKWEPSNSSPYKFCTQVLFLILVIYSNHSKLIYCPNRRETVWIVKFFVV
jgi:hypothetical protein